MQPLSKIISNEDLIVGLIRQQIHALESVLNALERGNSIDDYFDANLKSVEKKVRWLHRLLANNLN